MTAVIPIVLVVGVWLLLRLRFVRRATAAQRFIDADADLDLFALRALARQPMHRLARVSDDPAGAWRAQDPDVVRALALLELRDSGLRPPPAQRRRLPRSEPPARATGPAVAPARHVRRDDARRRSAAGGVHVAGSASTCSRCGCP